LNALARRTKLPQWLKLKQFLPHLKKNRWATEMTKVLRESTMDQAVLTAAPESRVLIVVTGGTICMKQSEDGLVPSQGFLEAGMSPWPTFNDGSQPGDITVVVDDGTEKSSRSLRTPISRYGKHVRYAVLEFEELLDSSSINGKS